MASTSGDVINVTVRTRRGLRVLHDRLHLPRLAGMLIARGLVPAMWILMEEATASGHLSSGCSRAGTSSLRSGRVPRMDREETSRMWASKGRQDGQSMVARQ